MRPPNRAGLWRLTTVTLLFAATLTAVAAVEIASGPWILLLPDGGRRIGLEVRDPPEAVRNLRLGVGSRELAPLAIDIVQRPLRSSTRLVSWVLPPALLGEAATGCAIRQDGQLVAELAGRAFITPGRTASVRALLAAADAYPIGQDLEQVSEAGQSVDVVALVGPGWWRSLGRGGWESQHPIALLAAETVGPELAPLAGEAVHLDVLSWGCLGLPVLGDVPELPRQLGSVLRPWVLPIDGRARWALDQTGGLPNPQYLELLDAARHLRLPLLISAGAPISLVSEPLARRVDGSIGVMPGGTRGLVLGGGIHPAVGLPGLIAQSLPPGTAWLLSAGEDLRLQAITAAGLSPFALVWSPWPERDHPPLSDPGLALIAELTAWRERGLEAQAAGRRLAWISAPELAAFRREGPVLARLRQAVVQDRLLPPEIERLLGETYPWPELGVEQGSGWGLSAASPEAADLATLPATALRQQFSELGGLAAFLDQHGDDPWILARCATEQPDDVAGWLLARERLEGPIVDLLTLRGLAEPALLEHAALAEAARRAQSHEALLALVAPAETAGGALPLELLRARLARQAEGQLAIDADPLMQHLITDVVLSSPWLSPTGLRPIAIGLEGRLVEPAAAAVRRFLERHGRERPWP